MSTAVLQRRSYDSSREREREREKERAGAAFFVSVFVGKPAKSPHLAFVSLHRISNK